jgi:hypothetical protein
VVAAKEKPPVLSSARYRLPWSTARDVVAYGTEDSAGFAERV